MPATTIDTSKLATLGELARRWQTCEATTRNVAKRLFAALPRIGKVHVLSEGQAAELREEMVRRGLIREQG